MIYDHYDALMLTLLVVHTFLLDDARKDTNVILNTVQIVDDPLKVVAREGQEPKDGDCELPGSRSMKDRKSNLVEAWDEVIQHMQQLR